VGNLIQIANHWLNVEEACSGIRSLQTAFMVSLFLGELHRLSPGRRLGLMLASFGLAFFVNLLRTLVLAYVTTTGATMEQWHDTVGVVAMVLCLLALWGLSEWIRPPAAAAVSAVRVAGPASAWRIPWPAWFATAGCAWLLTAEGLTGYWYLAHERRVSPAAYWHVEWPERAPSYAEEQFSERTLALLKFNTGRTAEWQVDAAYPWQMYALDWAPGRVSKFLSRSHYPTVCLPASGLKLVSELPPWDCQVGAVRLPFATYLFDQAGQSVYVFHAIVEDRPLRPGEHLAYRQVDAAERLASVWHGERNLGQHVIGIALRGAGSAEEAREIVARELQKIVQPGSARSPRTLALVP
jgi:exosortase/archaeosortase family protein